MGWCDSLDLKSLRSPEGDRGDGYDTKCTRNFLNSLDLAIVRLIGAEDLITVKQSFPLVFSRWKYRQVVVDSGAKLFGAVYVYAKQPHFHHLNRYTPELRSISYASFHLITFHQKDFK